MVEKNNKDIYHLVFSQLPFLSGLVKKVLVLEPRALWVLLRSHTIQLCAHIPPCPVFLFHKLLYSLNQSSECQPSFQGHDRTHK